MSKTGLARMLAALVSAVNLGSAAADAPRRYAVQADSSSRHSFQYVRDRVTRQWVYREFELRVALDRPLPEPLDDPAHGTLLSLQLFSPDSSKTGGLRSSVPRIADGFRVWSGGDVMGRADAEEKVAYGVNVAWPQPGAPTRYDALEVFPLPALGASAPGEWSPWISAASLRAGAFAWWNQVHGNREPAPPRPAYPFEFRWRLILTDTPSRVP